MRTRPIHTDGSLRFRGRVVVPQLVELREEILREFHCSRFAMHPGGTKMYHDLCHQYYWSGMKRHVGNVTPKKYPRIFIIIFIIYSRYKFSQLRYFLGIVK